MYNYVLCTDYEKQLSSQDKLDLIDFELRTLMNYCRNNGYRQEEITLAARPFLKDISADRRARLWKICIFLAIFAAIVIVAVQITVHVRPIKRFSKFVYRKSLLNLLPYWDWTRLSQKRCLVDNIFYRSNRIRRDDCLACESYTTLPRLKNVSQVVIGETYLRGDLPFIVTDDQRKDNIDWSFKFLNEFFKEEGLREFGSCLLTSNIRVQRGDHRRILHKAATNEITSFFAHWENCFKEASKKLRRLYHRPYFLPPMVELDDTNWVFISRDYFANLYKQVDTRASMLMFVQMAGKFSIRISPKNPCDETCASAMADLTPGDILVVPNFLWILDYLPMAEGENIAIGISGNFD